MTLFPIRTDFSDAEGFKSAFDEVWNGTCHKHVSHERRSWSWETQSTVGLMSRVYPTRSMNGLNQFMWKSIAEKVEVENRKATMSTLIH